MYLRMILFSTMVLFCSGVAMAQRPGPEFWRKVGCEPFEPRTKLEAIEDRHSTVVIKGFTRITTVEVRGVRIDAVEMRELGKRGARERARRRRCERLASGLTRTARLSIMKRSTRCSMRLTPFRASMRPPRSSSGLRRDTRRRAIWRSACSGRRSSGTAVITDDRVSAIAPQHALRLTIWRRCGR